MLCMDAVANCRVMEGGTGVCGGGRFRIYLDVGQLAALGPFSKLASGAGSLTRNFNFSCVINIFR